MARSHTSKTESELDRKIGDMSTSITTRDEMNPDVIMTVAEETTTTWLSEFLALPLVL
jgi:hypothetical protein